MKRLYSRFFYLIICCSLLLLRNTEAICQTVEHNHTEEESHDHSYEGKAQAFVESLDKEELTTRLIKEAGASRKDFERFIPFFEFNLKMYYLELEDLVKSPGFGEKEFSKFLNVKFREAVFEFKRFLQEEKGYAGKYTENDLNNLYKNLWKSSGDPHTPNQPFAAGQPCQNMDFANTTASWQGNYCRGYNSVTVNNDLNCFNGFGNGQYTKTVGGNDGNIAAIPRVPPGETSALRLGDVSAANDKATIWQTFRVSSTNYVFVYKWAAYLNNAGNHPASTSPYFKVRMYTNFGTASQAEITCATIDANSQTATSWGFTTSGSRVYKNWTTMFVPLQNYIGQDITIWFESSDCMVSGGSHEGYAYIWASCLPPELNMSVGSICAGNTATISAPSGAFSYNWTSNPAGAIVGATNTSSITVNQPNTTYSVTMTTISQAPYTPCSLTLDTLMTGTSNIMHPDFNPDTACAGGPTTFADLSVATGVTITSWAWDFNNDGTADATTQNASYTFPSAGTYPVKLTISDGSCPKDTTINVVVLANPTAAFSVANVCLGDSSVFINTSTPNAGATLTGYDWDISDGSSTNQQAPKHLFASSGNFSITLTVTSSNGCSNAVTHATTVNPLPVVDAGTTQTVCLTNSVNLTASGATSYTWSPVTGLTPSNTATVVSRPTVTTLYTVTGTDANGCKKQDTVTVKINPLPVASFTANNNCLNLATAFTNTSTISSGSITNNDWTFGDATTSTSLNPSHTYTAANTFNVTLITTSNAGCKDTATGSVTVYALPVITASAADPNLCPGESTVLTASGGSSYSWASSTGLSATTGSPVTASPLSTIIYTATGTDIHSCVGTDTVRVVVNPLAVADFTGTNACLGQQSSSFTDQSAVASGSITAWSWDLAGQSVSAAQNPTILFNSPGTKSVTLIATTNMGCKDTITKQVAVHALPDAVFTVSNVCFGDSVVPRNSSLPASVSITTYSWTFGDGGVPVSQEDPSNYYNTPNTYTINLWVIDQNGCRDSVNHPVTVFSLPVVTASATDPNICLSESTTLAGGGATTYLWSPSVNLNDTTGATVIATPLSTQIYTVEGIDTHGCIGTDTVQVIVNPLPVADFSGNNACLNQQNTQFNDLSAIASGSITSWNWTMPGQPSSSLQNPIVSFSSSGTKSVTLIVTSNMGCKDTISKNVQVFNLPQASFTSNTVCLNGTTTLTSNSVNGSGTINSLQWDLGDGNSATGATVTHVYASAGADSVTLYVSDSNGCKDTLMQQITVYPLPVADFSFTSVCAQKVTMFTNTSTVSTGSVVNYSWDFTNDGSNDAFTSAPGYTYNAGGIYPVRLIVESDRNCVDTITKNINVNYIPVSNFTFVNSCVYDSVSFADSSTIAQGTITGYDWIFGDGGTSVVTDPSHLYASCGVKAVTLVTTSDSGCVHAVTKQVTVYCKPTAQVVVSDVCTNIPASLSGTSSVSSDSPITQYSWDFGNATSGSGPQDTVAYLPGTYTVKLFVTTASGCKDTASSLLNVYPMPVADFTSVDSCLGVNTCFTNLSGVSGAGNSIAAYCWDFDQNLNTCESAVRDTCILFGADGVYNVSLMVETNHGCRDTVTHPITVYAIPLPDFTFNNACLGNNVEFTNQSTVPNGLLASYTWTYGDGTYGFASDPFHMYTAIGEYTVQLVAVSTHGCTDSIDKKVFVYPNPVVNFVADKVEGCELMCVNFDNMTTLDTVPPTSISSYQWYSSGGVWNDTVKEPTSVCFPAGVYDISLVIKTSSGCIDTLTKPSYLTVYPSPTAGFSFTPPVTTVLAPYITFFDESNGGNTVKWDFGDGNPSFQPSGEGVIHEYADTGTYTVTQIVSTNFGCIDSIKKTVIIGPDWTFYVPNTFTPNEDGKNDYFNGKGYGILKYEMLIFDRWGNLINRVDDINAKGWDGTKSPFPEPCQIDTYVYKVRLTDIFGKPHNYTGTVHLVR